MITCKSGITIRMAVADIREAGRATQGVRLIRLDDSDEIAAVARLDEQEVIADIVEENGEIPEGGDNAGSTETTDAADTQPTE